MECPSVRPSVRPSIHLFAVHPSHSRFSACLERLLSCKEHGFLAFSVFFHGSENFITGEVMGSGGHWAVVGSGQIALFSERYRQIAHLVLNALT